MAKQSITIELDDETLRCLAVLGRPLDVLAQLAHAAAADVLHSGGQGRAQTEQNRRIEQSETDSALATATEASAQRERTLSVERTQLDTLIVDQREANEQMVRATIRAQELAVEADEAKERAEKSELELRAVAEFREMFIGMLGHDLRNPLAAIDMAAALLLSRSHLDDEDVDSVNRIIRSGRRMSRMIAQLLDLTRARLGGGLPLEPKPTDLREVCRNMAEDLGATIQLQVDGDLTGTWDQDRLADVLSNLTRNAIEYAAPGTLVTVKAHGDGAQVVVEVSNQGDPIPADLLPVIFAPFRRAKRREKSPTGNLGLGLYIAHQIVLAHGGTLDARSADGTTTFAVRLPRCAPSERLERTSSSS